MSVDNLTCLEALGFAGTPNSPWEARGRVKSCEPINKRVGWCSGTLSGPVFQVGSGLPEHQLHLRQKIAGSTPADPTYVAEASYNDDGDMSG